MIRTAAAMYFGWSSKKCTSTNSSRTDITKIIQAVYIAKDIQGDFFWRATRYIAQNERIKKANSNTFHKSNASCSPPEVRIMIRKLDKNKKGVIRQ